MTTYGLELPCLQKWLVTGMDNLTNIKNRELDPLMGSKGAFMTCEITMPNYHRTSPNIHVVLRRSTKRVIVDLCTKNLCTTEYCECSCVIALPTSDLENFEA